MLDATRSRGNSSRMIPKQSGKMPPPRPCSARPTTTSSSERPSAATVEPAPNSSSEMTSIRRLPNMSPSRPATGVATAAASRYAVSTQAIPLASVPSLVVSSPSAGMSIVCASEYASAAPPRMSRLRIGCGRSTWGLKKGSRDETDWGVRKS